jgi:DtxR family Mn-dependent transcriptional regulator
MRKHRLAERLLVDLIGLPWEEVHAEACRWEHVMSEDVERRLVQVLDNPTVSPFGNPIPGLALLGLADSTGGPDLPELVRLTELPVGDSVAVVVRRLKEAGVVPNARVLVQTGLDGDVTIMVSGHENVELPHEMAHAVKVEKV